MIFSQLSSQWQAAFPKFLEDKFNAAKTELEAVPKGKAGSYIPLESWTWVPFRPARKAAPKRAARLVRPAALVQDAPSTLVSRPLSGKQVSLFRFDREWLNDGVHSNFDRGVPNGHGRAVLELFLADPSAKPPAAGQHTGPVANHVYAQDPIWADFEAQVDANATTANRELKQVGHFV